MYNEKTELEIDKDTLKEVLKKENEFRLSEEYQKKYSKEDSIDNFLQVTSKKIKKST